MTVIARDTVASDHLVYAWPFPIGPECEVSCADDEQVVMCPAWMVGDRLGPGRHLWRTPDPTRPVAAFFVLTAPVEVSFDLTTAFMMPATGQPVRIRAAGSIQVRCADPGLLVAQFVGLPFDSVNEGVLRSVSRSIERMLARLLTRRVVMAGTPYAVTDPGMLPGIVEELVAYNPTAGAVFGVELIRIGHLSIGADDGMGPYVQLPQHQPNPWAGEHSHSDVNAFPYNGTNGHHHHDHSQPQPLIDPQQVHADTIRGMPAVSPDTPKDHAQPAPGPPQSVVSGEIGGAKKSPGPPQSVVSGELGGKKDPAVARTKTPSMPAPIPIPSSLPGQRRAGAVEVQTDEITQPGIDQAKVATPPPGSLRSTMQGVPAAPAPTSAKPAEARGAGILGIGMGGIGQAQPSASASGEISKKVAPGGRVLVPGPNGLMESATVRQLLQGYYELEVGSTGQTIWVPMSGVVPE
ncbi:MAG: hypothetical protein JNL83_11040 [Myxococcales bacterium]|nr:hypothetical protein [Myxococcales bacterium]